MSVVNLPKAVENFVAANNAHDGEALFAVFADEAAIRDDGKTYASEAEIRGWFQSHLIAPKVVITPASFDGDRLVASSDGDFPGGPLNFVFTFATKDDLVTDLTIDPA